MCSFVFPSGRFPQNTQNVNSWSGNIAGVIAEDFVISGNFRGKYTRESGTRRGIFQIVSYETLARSLSVALFNYRGWCQM
jgi:hypothetical protein